MSDESTARAAQAASRANGGPGPSDGGMGLSILRGRLEAAEKAFNAGADPK